jgi:hypothetical protein
MAKARTVIYGIYGVRSSEIRQDLNALTIGDKQSLPTTRRGARRLAHFDMTSMESMLARADDMYFESIS